MKNLTTTQLFLVINSLKNQVIENEDMGNISKAEDLEVIISELEADYYSREDREVYAGQ